MTAMTRALRIAAAFGIAAVLQASGVAAQPADPEAREAPTDTSRPADAQTEASPSAEPAPPSGEVFIPTEEISEDFAVSFPVDI